MRHPRPLRVRPVVIGRCYLCNRPIRAGEQDYVPDPAVRTSTGKPLLRKVHAGDCSATLRQRLESDR